MSDQTGAKALKAGLWYIVCTFIMRGISFFTMPIFSRVLSVSEMGEFSNFSSWLTLLIGICTLDLYTSVNLAYFEYKKDINKYLSSIALCGTAYTTIVIIIVHFFWDDVKVFLGLSDYMLGFMFAYFLTYPAISILHAKFRIALEYKLTIITSMIPTILSTLISLICVLLFKDKLFGRVIGCYGTWVIFSLGIYAYILIKGRSFKIEYIKFALPISIPLIIHSLSNTILSSSDRVMITRICGSESTAYYSLAASCALLVSILWSAINQAWSPWCFEKLNTGTEKEIYGIAKPIVILYTSLVIMIMLIAPEILFILGGNQYVTASVAIPPVIAGYVAQMLYTFYVNIETYYKKQKQIMYGTLLAAILNIILNLIFIPLFGYVAAAYTTLIGYIALLVIHYYFVKKMGYAYIYNMKFNILILSITIALSVISSFLYKFFVLRWFLIITAILILTVFALNNRNNIIRAVRNKDFFSLLRILHLM